MIEEMTQPDAAVAIVRARGPVESVLLILRSERKDDPWSGHWSFPGGRRDPEDPDLLHTALRELEEECGIGLARERMERALPPTLARRETGAYVLVAPFLFGVDRELATVLEPLEAAAALWVPLRDLRDLTRHSLRPVPGRPPEMLFPAIELKGELPMELMATPLWGFTYRLIMDWLGMAETSSL
jgi:8-oxo-dGTP pyrophosphatase MutT (NUDIX family)